MGQSRTLQNSRRGCDDPRSRARDCGTVLAVPNVPRAKLAGIAADDGQSLASDEGAEPAAEVLITNADFAPAAGVVADIESSAGALVAEDRNAGQTSERVTGRFGSKS